MLNRNFRRPRVFVNKIVTTPPAVAPVATAIPVFIGYTPRVSNQGNTLLNIPIRISSLQEFESTFGFPKKVTEPHYYLLKSNGLKTNDSQIRIDGKDYLLLPDPDTVYYLHLSLKLFFKNGGGAAYIVSVGTYGRPSGRPANPGTPIVNRNVSLRSLQKGLMALKTATEASLYVFPDANLLSPSENARLINDALAQNEQLENAFSIIDVAEGRHPNQQTPENDIDHFRNRIGSHGLRNGAAYYPFLRSTIADSESIDYTNLFGGDVAQLAEILDPPSAPNPAVAEILKAIQSPTKRAPSVRDVHEKLLQTSGAFQKIMDLALSEVNRLPPSGAIAGIYAATDTNRGVWKAPANIAISGVSDLTIQIDSNTQQHLNVAPNSGKSVNAIRSFPGRGVRVWGARTLDSNNQEWRYIPVRRTIIFLEQSCQRALRSLAFEPNTSTTWALAENMIETFLESIYRQGGFSGAKPSDAYGAKCGLGATMTANDLSNGDLKVEAYVALTRPAEFIVFKITQKMSAS